MVAPVGVGKAATTVTETAEKLGSKGTSTATHTGAEHFENLLQEPQQPNAAAATGASQAAASQPMQVSTLQAKSSEPVGPGDKILRGIDQVRGEADKVVQEVGGLSETGGGNGGKVSDLMSMQASVVDFQVATQVGGKGVQETNQAVQTLLKGQ